MSEVFERFTDRARQVVILAQEEARTLEHGYIASEHILLGLLREEEGLGARVLNELGITTDQTRDEVRRIVGTKINPINPMARTGRIPFTAPGKKVLELALREALSLGHNYIGTEHVLLGLVRADEGVGMRILEEKGLDAQRVRDKVILFLSGPGSVPRGYHQRPVQLKEPTSARPAPTPAEARDLAIIDAATAFGHLCSAAADYLALLNRAEP